LSYTEDYDPKSPVWDLTRAGGFRVRPPGYSGAKSFFEYFGTLTKTRPHGELHGQRQLLTALFEELVQLSEHVRHSRSRRELLYPRTNFSNVRLGMGIE
jgi:hypothetical protein